VTVANPKGAEQSVDVHIPTEGTILFDRYTGQRIAGRHGEFHLAMQPWEFRAFEIRP
jgi:hypothetical protein